MPRKERSVGKEKAVQDPGLKDYVWPGYGMERDMLAYI
jgi:hypothetical protein